MFVSLSGPVPARILTARLRGTALQECNRSAQSLRDCGCIPTPGFRFWGREFALECSATTVQSEKLIVLLSTKSLLSSESSGSEVV